MLKKWNASKKASKEEAKRMAAIMKSFTPEEQARYEDYRQSKFPGSHVKKIISSVAGSAKVPANMIVVMGGIAKLFVGDLVETSRVIMQERSDDGPIRPVHLREAFRRLQLRGAIPTRTNRRPLFKRL